MCRICRSTMNDDHEHETIILKNLVEYNILHDTMLHKKICGIIYSVYIMFNNYVFYMIQNMHHTVCNAYTMYNLHTSVCNGLGVGPRSV
jgi:hypothetical protein